MKSEFYKHDLTVSVRSINSKSIRIRDASGSQMPAFIFEPGREYLLKGLVGDPHLFALLYDAVQLIEEFDNLHLLSAK